LKTFQFNQTFDMEEDGSLQVILSSGLNNKKDDIFMWQTAVTKTESASQTELLDWIERVHKHTSDIFKELCKKDFYGSFNP